MRLFALGAGAALASLAFVLGSAAGSGSAPSGTSSTAGSSSAPAGIGSAPAGIGSAPAGTLRGILANLDAKLGTEPAGVMVEDWSVSAYGLSGNEHVVRAGDDLRVTTSLGPFLEQQGRLHGQGWRQNANGITVLLSKSGRALSEVTSQTFLRALHDRGRLVFAGTLGTGAATQYVLEDHAGAGAGAKRRLVIDGRTWLPARLELELPGRRISFVADGYQLDDGYALPVHLHARDSLSPSNDVDWRLASLRTNVEAARASLQIPPSDRALALFPRGVTKLELPAHFVGPHVLLRVSVDGNPVDMLLDSGSGETAFDQKLTEALGFRQYGRSSEIAAGRYSQSRIYVHELRVGQLTLRNLAASSLPFDFKPRPGIRALGLLGFDLFADAVVHLDYQHQRVEAIARRAFHPGALREAIVLPVSIDDGVPLTPVQIDAGEARFVLDTGSPDAVLFSNFARTHPALKAEAAAVNATGVGGSLRIAPVQIASLEFAGEAFGKFVIQEAVNPTAFEASGAEGLMGYQFMRLFDWYFDEAGGAVYAVPNDTLRQMQQRTAG